MIAIGLTGLAASSLSAMSSRSPLASVPGIDGSDDEASAARLDPVIWSKGPVASSDVVPTLMTVSAARPIKHAMATQTVLSMAVPSLQTAYPSRVSRPGQHVAAPEFWLIS